MTGYQASMPATRIYLHLNLARDEQALIKTPAPGIKFERYHPGSPS
jgi:hypothetical protein